MLTTQRRIQEEEPQTTDKTDSESVANTTAATVCDGTYTDRYNGLHWHLIRSELQDVEWNTDSAIECVVSDPLWKYGNVCSSTVLEMAYIYK